MQRHAQDADAENCSRGYGKESIMRWKAIETTDGEARVIDVTTDRVMVVARINSEPFQGMQIANMIAAAPDTLNLLESCRDSYDKLLDSLCHQIDKSKEWG
jgi:hypothetical protein